jgi:PRC-barrel domain protein
MTRTLFTAAAILLSAPYAFAGDMRRFIGTRQAMFTLAFAGLLAVQPCTAPAESSTTYEVDLKAAITGYRASKLIYKPVTNEKSEVVGNLEDVILGADGKANFALIDVGSLSLGPHIVVIPFERLKIDKDAGTITLPGAVKSELQKHAVFP